MCVDDFRKCIPIGNGGKFVFETGLGCQEIEYVLVGIIAVIIAVNADIFMAGKDFVITREWEFIQVGEAHFTTQFAVTN